jgi:outer membrane protein OmpA-like peptidoglycan-associated protein
VLGDPHRQRTIVDRPVQRLEVIPHDLVQRRRLRPALLKQNSALKVSIEGHTDNTGTPAGNKTLSEQRASAVMAAIAKQGVATSRMSAVGWGQQKPVADNRTEAGRAKNRRVELVKK